MLRVLKVIDELRCDRRVYVVMIMFFKIGLEVLQRWSIGEKWQMG